MSEPVRIQRERKRGWRKPKNSVCVNRGTPYGNPFIVDPDKPAGTKIGRLYQTVPTIEDAVACYREYLQESPDLVEKIKHNLRGKTLLCFCPLDQPCHADILLELANSTEECMTISPRAIEAAVKAMKALEDEATADPENIFGADLTSLAKAALTAALAVDGLCLVPREPTWEMIEAGCEANPTQWNEGTDLSFAADVANDVYRAMLNAASSQGRGEK